MKVFIYQMGKVASSSIHRTLADIAGMEAIHTHHLNYANAKYFTALKKSLGWKSILLNPEDVAKLHKTFDAEDRTKIITLAREPISRNISGFFQTLDYTIGVNDAHATLTHEEMVEIFLKQYPHEVPLMWFDRELKEVTNIDVFNHPFPVDKGAMVINHEKHDVLVMHHDLNDSLKAAYIGEFLGLGTITIVNDNISGTKTYSKKFDYFKKHIRLPEDYINNMLESKYSRHFYGAKELERIQRYWLSENRI